MADYNVQMKQYNGTSFDNILPYASQALTLAGGGGATEIIAQARAGLSQIATGSYVGNGQNTVLVQVGFKPKIIMIQCVGNGSFEYDNTTGITMANSFYFSNKDSIYREISDNVYVGGGSLYMENMPRKIPAWWFYRSIASYGWVRQEWIISNSGFAITSSDDADLSDWSKKNEIPRDSIANNVSGVTYYFVVFG